MPRACLACLACRPELWGIRWSSWCADSCSQCKGTSALRGAFRRRTHPRSRRAGKNWLCAENAWPHCRSSRGSPHKVPYFGSLSWQNRMEAQIARSLACQYSEHHNAFGRLLPALTLEVAELLRGFQAFWHSKALHAQRTSSVPAGSRR